MKKLLIVILFVPTIAFAQQQQVSPVATRIATQIGILHIQIEETKELLSNTQLQLTQAQAEIKRLKEKYEPSSTEEKKQ